MRTFERTHPWLTFHLDLRRVAWTLWATLGECKSKCEHIAGVPLRPATASRLYRLYLARGALATSAIEGNTLSEDEVLRHLDGQLDLPPSRQYLAQEIDNIVDACQGIWSDVAGGRSRRLRPDLLAELNSQVLRDLATDDDVTPGRIRSHEVTVARYRGAPAKDCPYLLSHLCEWLGGDAFAGTSETAMLFAILKAIVAHLYLAWIHPFGDGNGRTARLVEFKILLEAGVPAPAAHLLSNHYNATRTEYYRQLDQASRSGGDVFPFIEYAVQGFRDGLRTQLDEIRDQQWDVTWRNYVHEKFRERTSATEVRRRTLVLALSQQSGPIPIKNLSHLSTELAAAYAGKTDKTIARDVTAVIKMELVEKTPRGIRARTELIFAFLPSTAEPTAPAAS